MHLGMTLTQSQRVLGDVKKLTQLNLLSAVKRPKLDCSFRCFILAPSEVMQVRFGLQCCIMTLVVSVLRWKGLEPSPDIESS